MYQASSRRNRFLAPYSQRGGGTIKAILWTAILIYGAFVAYKILPAYVAEYQLADKMQEQARFSVVNRSQARQARRNQGCLQSGRRENQYGLYRSCGPPRLPAESPFHALEREQEFVGSYRDFARGFRRGDLSPPGSISVQTSLAGWNCVFLSV